MSAFSAAFEDFNYNSIDRIKEWEDTRDNYLEEYDDLNENDPFLISHLEETFYDQVEEAGEEVDERNAIQRDRRVLKWYRARLVEHHMFNGYTGSKLERVVQDNLRDTFPDHVPPSSVFRRWNPFWTSESVSWLKEQVALQLYAGEPHSGEVDTNVANGIKTFVTERLEDGAKTFKFWFNALLDFFHYVWTSPVFFLVRWIIKSVFWVGLILVLLIVALSVALTSVKGQVYEVCNSIPLIKSMPSCQWMAPKPLLPVPEPTWLIQTTPLSTIAKEFTKDTNAMAPIVDNLLHVHNLSLNVFVTQQILSVTANDIQRSSSIIKASSIPFRGELLRAYKSLSDSADGLDRGLRDYRIKVQVQVQNIKGSL